MTSVVFGSRYEEKTCEKPAERTTHFTHFMEQEQELRL